MGRRLAAILAADVVGYSRLIRADEEGTLQKLKALRVELIERKLAEHNGRIVKLMGDGLLAEFASVVDAVRAAVETQEAVAARNAELPQEERIEFRVGINLGDVVIDDDDIYGDGVNVAARLEGLAEAGGICLSGAVHDQVKRRLGFAFEDLGERQVKNIDEPVRVYKVMLDGASGAGSPLATPGRRRARAWTAASMVVAAIALAGGGIWYGYFGAALRLPGNPLPRAALEQASRPSVAVLPFVNISNDENQEYFADGLTDDLITDLAKVSGLFVIARNTVFTYKGSAVRVEEVAKDLGVRYVVEGSVRRSGDRIRVNAQLVEGSSGRHMCAE